MGTLIMISKVTKLRFRKLLATITLRSLTSGVINRIDLSKNLQIKELVSGMISQGSGLLALTKFQAMGRNSRSKILLMTQNLSSFNSLVTTTIHLATVNILTLEKSIMTDINGLIQTVNLSLCGQEELGTSCGVDTRQKLLLTLQCLQNLVILLTRVDVISRFNMVRRSFIKESNSLSLTKFLALSALKSGRILKAKLLAS